MHYNEMVMNPRSRIYIVELRLKWAKSYTNNAWTTIRVKNILFVLQIILEFFVYIPSKIMITFFES